MSVDPNGSLGDFVIAPQPDSSPSLYQPVQVANNTTLTTTYQQNHVALGATVNAGYHTVVTFAPISAPTANSCWQLYSDGTNIYMLPPIGTGVAQQLNSSTLLASGTYWTQSQTISGAPAINVYYSCPLGASSIVITIQLTYPASTLSSNTIFVPYLDATGAAFSINAPISSFGIGILVNNASGGAYANGEGWGNYTTAGSATVSTGQGAYTNGVVMAVGKTFSTSTTFTVSATVNGII
jgi:hypothetical protein